MTQNPTTNTEAGAAADVAAIARGLTGAHRRLAMSLGNRWVKGTGFCHRSVGRDLEAAGLVESRMHRNERQIRAMPLGLAVRQHLEQGATAGVVGGKEAAGG